MDSQTGAAPGHVGIVRTGLCGGSLSNRLKLSPRATVSGCLYYGDDEDADSDRFAQRGDPA